MNKMGLVVVFLAGSIPVSFGHPDSIGMILFVDNQEIETSNSFNEEKKKVFLDQEIPFLSKAWMWQNFILLLCGGIVLIMSATVLVVFRKNDNEPDIELC